MVLTFGFCRDGLRSGRVKDRGDYSFYIGGSCRVNVLEVAEVLW